MNTVLDITIMMLSALLGIGIGANNAGGDRVVIAAGAAVSLVIGLRASGALQ